MSQIPQPTIVVDGRIHSVKLTGNFNQYGPFGSKIGFPGLTSEENAIRNAVFDGLRQELADRVSEIYVQRGSTIMARLEVLARRPVPFGAGLRDVTEEFISEVRAMDPSLGKLAIRYGQAWKEAADMGSPALFQEDLKDIVHGIVNARER